MYKMSFPTRPPTIPPKEISDLLSASLVVAVAPKEIANVHLLSNIGIHEFAVLLKDHASSLEGVLQFTPPTDYISSVPENTMHYLLVFHQPCSLEGMSERLSRVSGEKQIDFGVSETPDESGSLATFMLKGKYVKNYVEENEAYRMWLNSIMLKTVSSGKVESEIGNWEGNSIFEYTDPHPNPLAKLQESIVRTDDATLKQFLEFANQECRKRSLDIPTPPSPFPGPNPLNSTIDLKDLGTTLANVNAQLIQDLAGKGVLKTTPPKFHHFSGRKEKSDVSFEIWEHDIRMALKTHTPQAVRESVKHCLQGEILETVMSLGESATVEEILDALRPNYSKTQSYDTLLQEFFRLHQNSDEDVGEYAIRLNSKLAKIKRQYPAQFTPEVEDQYKRNRLFHGLTKELRDSLRSTFRDPSVLYNDLLAQARSIQREIQDKKSLESKLPIKAKAKVASSLALNTSSSQPISLDQLAQAVVACEQKQAETQKLVLEMSKTLEDI